MILPAGFQDGSRFGCYYSGHYEADMKQEVTVHIEISFLIIISSVSAIVIIGGAR